MNTRNLMNHSFKRMAANILSIVAILALAFPVTGSALAEGEPPSTFVWRDEFALADGWNWVNENPEKWTLTEQPGSLRIYTSPYGSGGENLLLRPVAEGDFSIETRLTFAPDTNFQFAGLILWQDESNFLQFGHAYCDIEGPCVGNGIYFDKVLNGEMPDRNYATQVVDPTVAYLRLVRSNEMVTGFYSDNGTTWLEIGTHQLPEEFQINGAGLTSAQDFFTEEWDIPADFDYFQLSEWRDEFDFPLADEWYWVNENADKLEFTGDLLRIYTSPYGSGGENLLLRPVAEGDFSIETRLFFVPDTNFQFAGLVIWQDESNFMQFGRAYCDIEGPCVGNGIYFDKVLEGAGDPTNFATQIENPFDPAEAYLRLERRGDMVRALYSHEGITWTEIGTHWIPPEFQVNGVGLTSAQDFFTEEWDVPADFDYFELTEGWGFLPEGFHDAESGDVPAWACNAYGWAVDPDDRAADIQVEVNVDGTSYFATAGEYREDLNYDGGCVDGSCGFSMSLWDTITLYETHNITAYAQDIELGEWVRLYNSPKELTCRTYDIYAYDLLTGETKQISNMRDADEYNPSWSPNGKKVVHDALFPDGSYSLYITDIKTGVSTKLMDGGNDAVWSPNGKWIAFDRAWTDTPHMYISSATGGAPTLVRENAMSADWAPNGKRLVFTNFDPEFGDWSVRTVAVDGGKGGETTVAPFGFNPVWSPDGNWIAYDVDGDIWKVQVNIQGTPLGEPIQLTSSPFLDGQPTWSPDSTTIVYHTGFGGDWDLWSVPAVGGTPTWLTGAVGFGDYDPSYTRSNPTVGYASFSPNGQAARTWMAAFTYDAGTWDPTPEVPHTYQYWIQGAPATEEFSFNVSEDAPLYDGYVLIRLGFMRASTPDGCMTTDTIHPAQETRFHIGWTFDGTYSEAVTFYENLNAQIRWDTTEPADMQMHEILSSVDWPSYTCTFTAGPPAPTIITIWHQWSGDYLETITDVFKQYVAEHPGVWIRLARPDDISSALAEAIPAGNGPDIIAFANDQIGAYALNNFIVPLDDYEVDLTFLEDTYEPAAVNGVVWQGKIWGLPVSQEAITLVYNKAVASETDFPSDPLDFDGLLAKAQAFYEANGIPLFCNQGFSGWDSYHVAPLFFGFDLTFPSYVDDSGNVYVNTNEKVTAGGWLVQFKPYLLPEMSHMICRDALIAKQVAAWWTGPWAIADLEANGVDYGFVTMGKPFVGIKTLMLSSNAVDRGNADLALDIMKFFTDYDMQKYMTLANKTTPANTVALYDPEVQALPSIAGFGNNASIGVPMANTPYAEFQWGPVGDAVTAIWNGSMTPANALAAAQIAIEDAIDAMMYP